MQITPGLLVFSFIPVAVVLHLIVRRRSLTRVRVLEIILLWLLVLGVGASGLLAFTGHVFNADLVAAMIGWPPGSPFQFEVGMANLAIGLIGVLCYKFRDNFWLATIIANGVFLFGDGIGHIRQLIAAGNFSPLNTGFTLYWDLGFPVVTLLLWLVLAWIRKDPAPAKKSSP